MSIIKTIKLSNEHHSFTLKGVLKNDVSLAELSFSIDGNPSKKNPSYKINIRSNKDLASIFLRICNNAYLDFDQLNDDRIKLTEFVVGLYETLHPKTKVIQPKRNWFDRHTHSKNLRRLKGFRDALFLRNKTIPPFKNV
jgi:hypothetical protein